MNILSYLVSRGLVDNITSGLDSHISIKRSVYIGVDPTAPSLHVGNLQGLVVAKIFQNMGFDVFILVGGFTGLIGDPSGKSKERNSMMYDVVSENTNKITKWLGSFFGDDICIVDNREWLSSINLLSYLNDIGKYFRVGPMISKDSVKNRINSDHGISYTEFSYQILQAYDFYHLFVDHGVSIQVGGSDQWGNITAGCEFVRKKINNDVFGLTFPLIVKEDGTKFGKTESGAIWLDKSILSEFMFYQSILGLADEMSIPLLKKLTFISDEEIESKKNLSGLDLQRYLAQELTRVVHGDMGLNIALKATKAIGILGDGLILDDIVECYDQYSAFNVEALKLFNMSIIELCEMTGLVESRARIKNMIKEGAILLNGQKLEEGKKTIERSEVLKNDIFVLSIGKKKPCVFRVLY